MNVKIQDIKDVTIKGVNVKFTDTCEAYKEDFFEWTAFPVVTEFKTNKIMAGVLQGWHHTPNFTAIEYHEDAEQFYFTEGTALMLFIDIAIDTPSRPPTVRLVCNRSKGRLLFFIGRTFL